MSSVPTPVARRLTAPSWKDARLLVGILLVLLSVIIAALAFRAADDRVGVWAADGTMTPGEPIDVGDLRRVDVQLGEASDAYYPSNERMPNGAVIDRELRPGELVPRSAVLNPVELDVRRVPIHVDPLYLSNLTKGSRVSVYAAVTPRARPGDEPAEYELIARRATVHALPTPSGGVIGSGSGSAAIIVVPEEQVAQLISLDEKDNPIKLVIEAGSPEKQD